MFLKRPHMYVFKGHYILHNVKKKEKNTELIRPMTAQDSSAI